MDLFCVYNWCIIKIILRDINLQEGKNGLYVTLPPPSLTQVSIHVGKDEIGVDWMAGKMRHLHGAE